MVWKSLEIYVSNSSPHIVENVGSQIWILYCMTLAKLLYCFFRLQRGRDKKPRNHLIFNSWPNTGLWHCNSLSWLYDPGDKEKYLLRKFALQKKRTNFPIINISQEKHNFTVMSIKTKTLNPTTTTVLKVAHWLNQL